MGMWNSVVMRTFVIGVVAIVGCALGNAQSFDFHSLKAAGQSRYLVQSENVRETVRQQGEQSALAAKLPEGFGPAAESSSAPPSEAASVPAPAPSPPSSPPAGPPVAVWAGVVGVLVISASGVRHVLRRQAA